MTKLTSDENKSGPKLELKQNLIWIKAELIHVKNRNHK